MHKILSVLFFTFISTAPAVANAEQSFISNVNCEAAYRYYFLNRSLASKDNLGAEIMLKQGADPNGRDYQVDCVGGMEPDTPLVVAATTGNLEMVKVLLEAGANPNIPVSEGITSLLVAVEHDRADIAELLLKHEADPNLKGLYKKPIEVAKEKNNQEMIQLLEKYSKEN